jgi:hypothetical protein
MPHLDHTGPTGSGSKTGRKLGKCKKTESEMGNIGEIGKGMGRRRKSGLQNERKSTGITNHK